MNKSVVIFSCPACKKDTEFRIEQLSPCLETRDFGVNIRCTLCGQGVIGDDEAMIKALIAKNPQHPVWDHLRNVFLQYGTTCDLLDLIHTEIPAKWWQFGKKININRKNKELELKAAGNKLLRESMDWVLKHSFSGITDAAISFDKLGKVLATDPNNDEARYLRLCVATGLLERMGGTTNPFSAVETWERAIQLITTDISWAKDEVKKPIPDWAKKFPPRVAGYLFTQEYYTERVVQKWESMLPEWRQTVGKIKASRDRKR